MFHRGGRQCSARAQYNGHKYTTSEAAPSPLLHHAHALDVPWDTTAYKNFPDSGRSQKWRNRTIANPLLRASEWPQFSMFLDHTPHPSHHPTPTAISPTRAEAAKTASLPRDAPLPKRARISSNVKRISGFPLVKCARLLDFSERRDAIEGADG